MRVLHPNFFSRVATYILYSRRIKIRTSFFASTHDSLMTVSILKSSQDQQVVCLLTSSSRNYATVVAYSRNCDRVGSNVWRVGRVKNRYPPNNMVVQCVGSAHRLMRRIYSCAHKL